MAEFRLETERLILRDWRGDADWDEFFRVIRGNGPCNKERLALRRFSYEQGEWVRRAILDASTTPPRTPCNK